MKYWARNGQWNWICNTEEYEDDGKARLFNPDNDDMQIITYTYRVTNFWNYYNGERDVYPNAPVYGNTDTDKMKKPIGWRGAWVKD